jgi:hypothetical protein
MLVYSSAAAGLVHPFQRTVRLQIPWVQPPHVIVQELQVVVLRPLLTCHWPALEASLMLPHRLRLIIISKDKVLAALTGLKTL